MDLETGRYVLYMDGRTLSSIRTELEKIESFSKDMKQAGSEAANAVILSVERIEDTLKRLEMDALSEAIDWNLDRNSPAEMKEEEDLRWLPF